MPDCFMPTCVLMKLNLELRNINYYNYSFITPNLVQKQHSRYAVIIMSVLAQ